MGGRDTILIVDDMEVNRVILHSVFEDEYHILEAENGQQALMLLKQMHMNIVAVLLDLIMPVKDGYQVMTELKEAGLLAEFPVIVITAEDSAENEVRAFDLGASDIIMKPFEPHVVKRRVQNVVELNLRRLNQEELIEAQAAKLRASNGVMVDALSSIIEYRSVETGQHIQRIRMFTQVLLEEVARSYAEYDLNERNIRAIVEAASLHDIGKIAIPDSILNKPGQLTAEEFEVMKTHTVKGCEMLANLDGIGDKEYLHFAYNICRYHHERWDGLGYPDGLKGESIPICAQVVGIADCYDALTTDRVYKKAISTEKAFHMLLNGECGEFSPKLLECLKNIQASFAQLAKDYADGNLQRHKMLRPDLPTLPASDNSLDTLQMGQLKYFTMLRYADATVMEVDFATGFYHLVYLSDEDFECLKVGACLEESFSYFAAHAVHPADKDAVLQLLEYCQQDFFENGFMKYRWHYRVYQRKKQNYSDCQMMILRIDTDNPLQKKAMLIWQMQKDTKEDTAMAAASDKWFPYSMMLGHLLNGIRVCRNDRWLTLLHMNDGLQTLLGYSANEIKELFFGRYLNCIHPEDEEKVMQQITQQLRAGNVVELEYRLITKNRQTLWVLDKGQLICNQRGEEELVCLLMDITQSKQDQEQLRRMLECHKIIMEQSEDIIFEWDLDEDSVVYSANWEKKYGYLPISNQVSQKISQAFHIHPEDLSYFMETATSMVRGMSYKEIEFRIADLEGQYRWSKMRAMAQFDELGNAHKVVGVITDIDEAKRASQALQYQAERDELTQLYNKRAGRRLIEDYLKRCNQNESCAMVILDVDNFKLVNDNYGHMFGDVVLQEIAKELRRLFRSGDVISRIGGDEFLVLIGNIPKKEVLEKRMDVIVKAFQQLFLQHSQQLSLSCSIGVAICPQDGSDFESLFQHCDLALYQAKSNGKNRYQFYDSSMEHPFGVIPFQNTNTRIESDQESDLVMHQIIERIFHKLYAADDLDQAVYGILEMIGMQFDVSRVYIFEDAYDESYCNNTYEWCKEGVQPQKEVMQNFSYAFLGGREIYMRLFNEKGIFYCPDIVNLPKKIYQTMASQNIRSVLQCAIRDQDGIHGFVGFDECASKRLWTKEQISALSFISKLLSAFLLKKRAQNQAIKVAEDLRAVLNHQNAWIYIINPQTYQLQFLNAKVTAMFPQAKEGMLCYEALFQQKEPCVQCPVYLGLLHRAETIEMYHPLRNVWAAVEATPLYWNHQQACLMSCYDVTKYHRE